VSSIVALVHWLPEVFGLLPLRCPNGARRMMVIKMMMAESSSSLLLRIDYLGNFCEVECHSRVLLVYGLWFLVAGGEFLRFLISGVGSASLVSCNLANIPRRFYQVRFVFIYSTFHRFYNQVLSLMDLS